MATCLETTPGRPPLPGGEIVPGTNKRVDKIAKQLAKFREELKTASGTQVEWIQKRIDQWEQLDLDREVDAAAYGYEQIQLHHRQRPALEELIRWRLWDRTGGGLMAELGSHQLDAASIFISALKGRPGEKVHPLAVHAVGGRHTFPQDRDAEDHVYCMFEFPGQGYDYEFPVGYKDEINNVPDPKLGVAAYQEDNNKKIVVTYSSINGNGFGGYGEVVMGTRGTLVLEKEQEIMLYKNASTSAKAGVKVDKQGTPTLDTTQSGDAAPAQAAAEASGEVSRGYREEIEHWAWCIQSDDWSNQPRCNGKTALGDAVIALVAKMAIANSNQGKSGYIDYNPEWFDVDSDEVPEANEQTSSAQWMAQEKSNLGC